MKLFGASIISIDEFEKIRSGLGKIIMVSGGYDPIHPGHISNILEAKKLGDTLLVVVNGDNFLKMKKGKEFQNLETRCQIVSAIHCVDYVIPFEIENDQTVCVALEMIRPDVFAKGGDRTGIENIPEWGICQTNNIEIVTGVGLDKYWSSSDFLSDWVDFVKNK